MPCYNGALITTMVYNGWDHWGRDICVYLEVIAIRVVILKNIGHLQEMERFGMDLNIGACK